MTAVCVLMTSHSGEWLIDVTEKLTVAFFRVNRPTLVREPRQLVSHVPGPLNRYSDSPRAGRSWDRIPVGAEFIAPIQTDPGAHRASCAMGTGYFLWVKWPGRGVDYPLPSSAKVKERVEWYLYSPLPLWVFTICCSRMNFSATGFGKKKIIECVEII